MTSWIPPERTDKRCHMQSLPTQGCCAGTLPLRMGFAHAEWQVCYLPSRAEPVHGAGLPPADQGNRTNVKSSVTENHALSKHLEGTSVLAAPDKNWIQQPAKTVQGLNRICAESPLNQPQLLRSREPGLTPPSAIMQQVWSRAKSEAGSPAACSSWTVFSDPSTLP